MNYSLHRIAKRLLDNKNFFGGVLHVFYIPELETLAETKAKLIQRRKDVTIQIKKNQQDLTNPTKFIPKYVLLIMCHFVLTVKISNDIYTINIV